MRLQNVLIDEMVDAYDVPFRMKIYFSTGVEYSTSRKAAPNIFEALSIGALFCRDR